MTKPLTQDWVEGWKGVERASGILQAIIPQRSIFMAISWAAVLALGTISNVWSLMLNVDPAYICHEACRLSGCPQKEVHAATFSLVLNTI